MFRRFLLSITGLCAACASIANAEPIPINMLEVPSAPEFSVESYLSEVVWIQDPDGKTLGVGETALMHKTKGSALEVYFFRDTQGRLITLSEVEARSFATAYKRAMSSAYMGLQGSSLDTMLEHRQQMQDMIRGTRIVFWATTAQNYLLKADGILVGGLVFGWQNAARSVPKLVQMEVEDQFAAAPTTFARQFAISVLQEGISELDDQILWAQIRITTGIGATPERPLIAEEVDLAYRRSIKIDSFLMPTANFLIETRDDTSFAGQFRRGLGKFGGGMGAVTGDPLIGAAAELNTYTNIMDQALTLVPAFGELADAIEERKQIWIEKVAGNGLAPLEGRIDWVSNDSISEPIAERTAEADIPWIAKTTREAIVGLYRPSGANDGENQDQACPIQVTLDQMVASEAGTQTKCAIKDFTTVSNAPSRLLVACKTDGKSRETEDYSIQMGLLNDGRLAVSAGPDPERGQYNYWERCADPVPPKANDVSASEAAALLCDPRYYKRSKAEERAKLIASLPDVNAKCHRNEFTPLHIAAIHGKPRDIRNLVDAGADLSLRYREVQEYTYKTTGLSQPHAITLALKLNDDPDVTRTLMSLMQRARVDLSANDVSYDLLSAAVERSNIEFIHKLVRSFGVTVNAQGRDGATALHLAAQQGDAEAVKQLLELGADATIRDNTGAIASQYAVYSDVSDAFQ